MLVKELIAKLQTCNPNALVFSEGCDCVGNAGGVAEEIRPDDVFASRTPEEPHRMKWAYDIPTVTIRRAADEAEEMIRDLILTGIPIEDDRRLS